MLQILDESHSNTQVEKCVLKWELFLSEAKLLRKSLILCLKGLKTISWRNVTTSF